MKPTILKLALVLLGIPVLFIVALVAYNYFTYIDETVTKGTAYGFKIGQTKEEALLTAKELYKNENIKFAHSHPVKSNAGSLIIKQLSEVDENLIIEIDEYMKNYPSDKWDFLFEGSFFNRVTLKFKDRRIVEITRHRQNFELP